MTVEESFKALMTKTTYLNFDDIGELDEIVRKGKMLFENFLPTKGYRFEIEVIKFNDIFLNQNDLYKRQQVWAEGKKKLNNLFETALIDYIIQVQQKEEAKNDPTSIENLMKNVTQNIQVKEKIITVEDTSKIVNLTKKLTKLNWIIFSIMVFFSSLFLWIFFYESKWHWYLYHTHRIGLTLMINLFFVFVLLNIPLKKKWLIILEILSGLIIALFSII